MVKYIIVPNYCPLYAMSKCFGPTHGPLTKPCPTPVDIIRELLLQTGVEKVHIYEVGYDTRKKTTYGEPVQLNMNNYKIPYEQLVRKTDSAHDVGEVVTEEVTTSEVITPTIITEAEVVMSEKSSDSANIEGASQCTEDDIMTDVVDTTEDTEAPAEEIKVEEEKDQVSDITEQVTPTRRLSKSERRALRRHAEEQRQENTRVVTEEVSE